ncbi:probable sesquiterpene synthase [Spinacia oleracea]|uniref:Probable sesquiterpene synthase n=1 Tax=Spinacia oleracea TaxID=3562 RepID=A0A9R0K9G1_SPIOL|nr:probable sesquiterpene synthase [Spinacia oleracea]
MTTMQCQNQTPTEVVRPLGNYHPDLWGDRFLNYSPPDKVTQTKMENDAAELKELVRKELLVDDKDPKERLIFLDVIHRLGIAYHFETEIDDTFHNFHNKIYDDSSYEDDLYYVSLRFRLLRQHGLFVSTDVFEKFKSEDGSFNKCLDVSDVHGILSLYEASYLKVHGENALDETLAFAKAYLTSVDTTQLSSPIAKHIARSLKLPLHRRSLRLESRHQISFYEAKSSHNENLLKFAKLDFNLLQILHNTELNEITRWWRNSEIVKNLPFVRDRIVEAYFWILGVYHEPKYSYARMILNKFFKIISILDDIYDSYGTIDELQPFTDAILRNEKSCIDQLPYYLKVTYQVIQDTFEEVEKDLDLEHKSYAVNYVYELMKVGCDSYLEEAKWRHEEFVPSFDEYMRNGVFSSGYLYIAAAAYLGMGEDATKAAFDWVNENTKVLKASCIVGRLINDISSHKIEINRGHVSTALNSHMGQFGTSMEEAIEVLRSKIEEAWMDINESILGPKPVAVTLLTRAVNLTRVLYDVYHDDEDGYTMSQFIKEEVTTILIQPIVID